MNEKAKFGTIEEATGAYDKLWRLIDRAAAHWMSLDPGVPFEGAIDAAMEAAVAEIKRLRQQLANRESELRASNQNWEENRKARIKASDEAELWHGVARAVGDIVGVDDGPELYDVAAVVGKWIDNQCEPHQELTR